jgi:hypothetical protein
MKKNIEYTKCPYCKSVVEVDVDFAIRNGRIFCNSCCKSFEIHVGKEEPPPIPKSKKEEVDDDGFW